MTYYADIVKPIAARNVNPSIIYGFATGIGEVIDGGRNKFWTRSIVEIYSAEDDYTYECQTVLAKCSACGRRFEDITFTDNDGSVTSCPHCGATLWW